MTTWRIYNAIDGTDLGEYVAESRAEALRMFLADTDDAALAPGVTAERARGNRAGTTSTTSDPFKSLWDLASYLDEHGRRLGWRRVLDPGESWKNYRVYQKRYGSVWYRLLLDTSSTFVRSVFITPTTYPLGHWKRSDAEQKEIADKFQASVEVSGLTMDDVERAVEQMAANWRSFSGPRRKRNVQHVEWRTRGSEGETFLQGEDAIRQWKIDVERVLQEEIDGFGKVGIAPDTNLLVEDVTKNHMMELDGVKNGPLIRGILDSMARRGLIEKWAERHQIEWTSLNFVAKRTR